MMIFLVQLFIVLFPLGAVAGVGNDHSTKLYRASRVGASAAKKAAPVKMRSMWQEEVTITDLAEVGETDEEIASTPHLLAAPGPERRWAWPTLAMA